MLGVVDEIRIPLFVFSMENWDTSFIEGLFVQGYPLAPLLVNVISLLIGWSTVLVIFYIK